MSISNYGELKTAIADWLDRSDLTSRIPDFITFAEARIHYGAAQGAMMLEPIRIRAMVSAASLAVSNARASLPADFLEARHVAMETEPKSVVELLDPELFWRMDAGTVAGTPRRATIEGDDLVLSPPPDTSANVELTYYAAFDALADDADTNWLLQNAPDVYLFAALVEAALFTKNRSAADDYLIRYASAALALTRQDRRAMSAGSSWSIKLEGARP